MIYFLGIIHRLPVNIATTEDVQNHWQQFIHQPRFFTFIQLNNLLASIIMICLGRGMWRKLCEEVFHRVQQDCSECNIKSVQNSSCQGKWSSHCKNNNNDVTCKDCDEGGEEICRTDYESGNFDDSLEFMICWTHLQSVGQHRRNMMLRMMLLSVGLRWRRSVRTRPRDTPPTPSVLSGHERCATWARRMWRSSLLSPAVTRYQWRSVDLRAAASNLEWRSAMTWPRLS